MTLKARAPRHIDREHWTPLDSARIAFVAAIDPGLSSSHSPALLGLEQQTARSRVDAPGDGDTGRIKNQEPYQCSLRTARPTDRGSFYAWNKECTERCNGGREPNDRRAFF